MKKCSIIILVITVIGLQQCALLVKSQEIGDIANGWFEFNQTLYRLVQDNELPWKNASEACGKYGMHLIKFETENEGIELKSVISKRFKLSSPLWIANNATAKTFTQYFGFQQTKYDKTQKCNAIDEKTLEKKTFACNKELNYLCERRLRSGALTYQTISKNFYIEPEAKYTCDEANQTCSNMSMTLSTASDYISNANLKQFVYLNYGSNSSFWFTRDNVSKDCYPLGKSLRDSLSFKHGLICEASFLKSGLTLRHWVLIISVSVAAALAIIIFIAYQLYFYIVCKKFLDSFDTTDENPKVIDEKSIIVNLKSEKDDAQLLSFAEQPAVADMPQIVESSDRNPEVIEEQPEDIEEQPEVIEENLVDIQERPEIADNKPTIISENPIIIAEKPKILEEKPTIYAEKPKIVEEKPTIIAEKPKIVEERPNIIAEKPKIVEEKPTIIAEKPKIVEEKPKILAEKPKIVEDKPTIIAEKPKIVEDKPNIIAEKPPIVEEDPNIVFINSQRGYGKPPIVEKNPNIDFIKSEIADGKPKVVVISKPADIAEELPKSLEESPEIIDEELEFIDEIPNLNYDMSSTSSKWSDV